MNNEIRIRDLEDNLGGVREALRQAMLLIGELRSDISIIETDGTPFAKRLDNIKGLLSDAYAYAEGES